MRILLWLMLFVLGYLLVCAGFQWCCSRSLTRQLMRIRNAKPEDGTSAQSLEDPRYGVIAVNSSALIFEGPKSQRVEIPWQSVDTILAYKRDLFTTDLICLAFEWRSQGTTTAIELHEEMKNFRELIDELPKYFALRNPEWWAEVAFPAFESNEAILWSRTPE